MSGHERRQTFPLLVMVACATVFSATLALGLVYVRLLHGPISLGFLVPSIERAIAEELSGLSVRVENAALRIGETGKLQFELTDVLVSDSAGAPVAAAPAAAISLSRKALLRARIATESIDLISPRLVVFYNDDGTLSLKFSAPAEASEPEQGEAPSTLRGSLDATPAPKGAFDGSLGRIDLVKTLSDVSASARRREHASAYLREIGLRSATVIIDNGNRKSIWRVPELDIDLDHRRSRSSIAGRARIDSLAGAWDVHFRTFQRESTDSLQLAISMHGLVPRGLARAIPQLASLEGVDLPIWAEAHLDLSASGDIRGGNIEIDAAPGRVFLPWLATAPMHIDGGHLTLSYSSATRRFEVAPSTLVWGDSRLQFAGSVAYTPNGPEGPAWAFDLRSREGWLGAEPPAVARLPIDHCSVRGFLAPERGRVLLSEFLLRAGGTEISAQGDVADMGGALKARLEGKIGAMSVATFKALWPQGAAPETRGWVSQRLARGTLLGGTFRMSRGAAGSSGADWTAKEPDEMSLTLEGADLAFTLADGAPPIEAPRALLRLDGQIFELSVPDATLAGADGRKLGIRSTITVDLNEPVPRTARVAVRAQGPLPLALEALNRQPVLQGTGVDLANIDGKVDAQVTAFVPVGQPVQLEDVRLEGKARISDGRIAKALGPHDIQGANITVDMSGTAVEAKGEMLVNGVLAKSSWQHVFGAAPDKQPPLRITASLFDNDRTQLGLDINDIVQGEVGVEVTVVRDARNERHVHLRADLANAELVLDSIAWRKPRGRPSVFEFDVAKGSVYPVELHNVRLVGDDIAVEGWMGVGPDHRVKEYRFPQFSLNVISSLEVVGKLRADNIWEVNAKGARYDGRDLFRSFFDINPSHPPPIKIRPGVDLKAEIDTVLGYSDATLRGVKVSLQKRSNKLTGLDARGTLTGGQPFSAVVRNDSGQPRRLLAESRDAGQLFKLVGFYPNAEGGSMKLEVNLDGQGPAQRTGTLLAESFDVLGDPVVSEVLQNADGSYSAAQGGRRPVARERLHFHNMRVPFSVGHGQFVMHNASLNGPLDSVSMRGKVDFRAQALNVGGTYTPLSEINRLLRPIPLVGELMTGPGGEGVFAMTFAIQGPMANPQVIVNPFSMLTPGITREIMQMTPEDPRVQPRPERPASRDSKARASSSPAAGAAAGQPGSGIVPEIGGGWSAETSQSKTKKR